MKKNKLKKHLYLLILSFFLLSNCGGDESLKNIKKDNSFKPLCGDAKKDEQAMCTRGVPGCGSKHNPETGRIEITVHCFNINNTNEVLSNEVLSNEAFCEHEQIPFCVSLKVLQDLTATN